MRQIICTLTIILLLFFVGVFFVHGPWVFLSSGKYRYCASYEPQGNFPGVILGREPIITHISSLYNLYNCTGCNDVNIAVFLPKSERSEFVSISKIAVFLFFFFKFILQYVLPFIMWKINQREIQIAYRIKEERRKPIEEHED